MLIIASTDKSVRAMATFATQVIAARKGVEEGTTMPYRIEADDEGVSFEKIPSGKRNRANDQRTPSPRFFKECDGKHRHPRHIAEALAARASVETGSVIGSYKCHFCGKYHVGHTPTRLINARGTYPSGKTVTA